VPFRKDKIVQAPCLNCDCEIDDTLEERVWASYGMSAPRPVASDSVSPKVEARSEQLRSVVRPETRPADCATSPAAGITSGAEVGLLELDRETPAVRDNHPPDTDYPTETNETKTQELSADGWARR